MWANNLLPYTPDFAVLPTLAINITKESFIMLGISYIKFDAMTYVILLVGNANTVTINKPY